MKKLTDQQNKDAKSSLSRKKENKILHNCRSQLWHEAQPCFETKTNPGEQFVRAYAQIMGKSLYKPNFVKPSHLQVHEGWQQDRAGCKLWAHYLVDNSSQLHASSRAQAAAGARQNISSSDSAFESVSCKGCPNLEQLSPHLCLGLVRLRGAGRFLCSPLGIAPSQCPSPWLVCGCTSDQNQDPLQKRIMSEDFMPTVKEMLHSCSPSLNPSIGDRYVPMIAIKKKFPSVIQEALYLLDENVLALTA